MRLFKHRQQRETKVHAHANSDLPVEDLFDKLALDAIRPPSTPSRAKQENATGHIRHSVSDTARNSHFVGGFLSNSQRPTNQVGQSAPAVPHNGTVKSFPTPSVYPPRAPGPLPAPPKMPTPVLHTHRPTNAMSRTMQHALADPSGQQESNPYQTNNVFQQPQAGLRPPPVTLATRPQSDPVVPQSSSSPTLSSTSSPQQRKRPPPSTPQRATEAYIPSSAPSKPSRSYLLPPITPPRLRATSAPPSPSSSSSRSTVGISVQCSGRTRTSQRCKNVVRAKVPLEQLDPNTDEEIERFCHVHTKEILGSSSLYCNEILLEFKDWIPDYLQENTQAALRSYMAEKPKDKDKFGYIYTFEILDPDNPHHTFLKVGRATHLKKRINEWSKQCNSKEQTLRGWWPNGMDRPSLLKSKVDAGTVGPWCHKVERLVHLELADLSQNALYLHPDFPNVKIDQGSTKNGKKNAGAKTKERCPDCHTFHREIFSFPRATGGQYEGKEYELIVKPVIAKWGDFVTKYYG